MSIFGDLIDINTLKPMVKKYMVDKKLKSFVLVLSDKDELSVNQYSIDVIDTFKEAGEEIKSLHETINSMKELNSRLISERVEILDILKSRKKDANKLGSISGVLTK